MRVFDHAIKRDQSTGYEVVGRKIEHIYRGEGRVRVREGIVSKRHRIMRPQIRHISLCRLVIRLE